MAFLAGMNPLVNQPWVVWIRPGRTAPPLDTISFQEIERQLRMALLRLPALDGP